MMLESRIFVAGHRGLVGGAVVAALRRRGFENLLLAGRETLDLTDRLRVREFLADEKPTHVVMAAAKVGGIHANNTYPADFLRDNLQIQDAVIDGAWRAGVKKFCFLGSSCIYPRLALQPITEEALLTGPLEQTNEWYAIAKIAGIKMLQAYRRQYGFDGISLMPTNLYGPGDNFHPENSHVVPALMRRFHEAKLAGTPEVVVWGTGTPRREFLYVDDLAEAVCHLLAHYSGAEPINIGTGVDVTIRELAETVARVTGYTGRLGFDPSKPDGTPRKVLDVSKATALGFRATVSLEAGLARTYEWFKAHAADFRR
jgi:GDP-L-fucose synthase